MPVHEPEYGYDQGYCRDSGRNDCIRNVNPSRLTFMPKKNLENILWNVLIDGTGGSAI
jgi:hypothetical protein